MAALTPPVLRSFPPPPLQAPRPQTTSCVSKWSPGQVRLTRAALARPGRRPELASPVSVTCVHGRTWGRAVVQLLVCNLISASLVYRFL